MTTLRLGEVVVDAIIGKLKTGLAERISAINAEKDDGIIVGAPRTEGGPSLDGSDFYTGGAGNIPDMGIPAVIVAEGIAEYEEEGPHAFFYSPLLLVRVIDQAAERELLDRKLKRLSRAVIETLWDDPPREALLGSAFTLSLYQSRPGPVSEPDIEVVHWRSHFDVIFRAVQSEGD